MRLIELLFGFAPNVGARKTKAVAAIVVMANKISSHFKKFKSKNKFRYPNFEGSPPSTEVV